MGGSALKQYQDRNTRPVYVSAEWHKKLRIIAAERDVRIGTLIEEALEQAFVEPGKKGHAKK